MTNESLKELLKVKIAITKSSQDMNKTDDPVLKYFLRGKLTAYNEILTTLNKELATPVKDK